MTPRLRKLALTAHVACSVGTLGAVAAFLALAVIGLAGHDALAVRGAYLAMEPIAVAVVVPLLGGALVTGVVQALGTEWGLFRHHWVLAKLLITAAALAVLLLQIDGIALVARAAAEAPFAGADLRPLRISFVVHAAGGLMALLAPVALSLFKPRGLTRYGWRKRHAARAAAIAPGAESTGVPR